MIERESIDRQILKILIILQIFRTPYRSANRFLNININELPLKHDKYL